VRLEHRLSQLRAIVVLGDPDGIGFVAEVLKGRLAELVDEATVVGEGRNGAEEEILAVSTTGVEVEKD
jgi:hypothetical protein